MLAVLDEEDFRFADVVFRYLKLCHMCGCMGLKRGELGEGVGGANGLWEMVQSIFNKGQSGMNVAPYIDGHHAI